MAVQTTISQYFLSGQVGDDVTTPGARAIPALNLTGSDLAYGLAYVGDSANGSEAVKNATASTVAGDVLGVLTRIKSSGPYLKDGSVVGANGLPSGSRGHLKTSGQVVVAPEQTVTSADPVYVRIAPGTSSSLDTIGSFRKDNGALTVAAGGTVYAAGDRVYADTAKVYECITGGTSGTGPATPPTGTSQDITDGTVHWKYVGACAASGVTAIALPGAKYRLGQAEMNALRTSGVAVLEVNLPQ